MSPALAGSHTTSRRLKAELQRAVYLPATRVANRFANRSKA